MLNTPQTTYVHTSHMSTTCTWFDFGTERQPFKIRIFRPILAAKAFKSQQLVRCISRWITPKQCPGPHSVSWTIINTVLYVLRATEKNLLNII